MCRGRRAPGDSAVTGAALARWCSLRAAAVTGAPEPRSVCVHGTTGGGFKIVIKIQSTRPTRPTRPQFQFFRTGRTLVCNSAQNLSSPAKNIRMPSCGSVELADGGKGGFRGPEVAVSGEQPSFERSSGHRRGILVAPACASPAWPIVVTRCPPQHPSRPVGSPDTKPRQWRLGVFRARSGAAGHGSGPG